MNNADNILKEKKKKTIFKKQGFGFMNKQVTEGQTNRQ